MSRIVLLLVLLLIPQTLFATDKEADGNALSALELFELRIMPIFKSDQPASCVQCHLSSVDLKDYILPSHEQTFASLRDQGLIDLEAPENSKILTLIQMGEKDLDQGARLIHQEMRKAEYDAFVAWIKACCADPDLRQLPVASELARPDRPDEVIRHARKSRVVDSFVRNVWSQRMRCFPCHTPHELDESDPKHAVAIRRHRKFLEENEQFADRMNIFRETPEATLEHLIQLSRESSPDRLPMINLDDPRNSLLVLKPTSKIPAKNDDGTFAPPSSKDPVSHMGGLKMHVDDQSYKSFLVWIEDYARVVGDKYTSVEDLPADNWFASKHVIIMREMPQAVPDLARIQLFVYGWDDQKQSWGKQPVAFTQGTVTPRRIVAGSLFLFGPTGHAGRADLDPENARLAPGKYLLRAHVDSQHRLVDDPTLLLGEEDFLGQAVIEARWDEGFPNAEKLSGTILQSQPR